MKPRGHIGKVKGLYLTNDIIAWLKKRARENCRSDSAEAVFIFTQLIKSEAKKPKSIKS